VIVDLMLPDGDGEQVVQQIRDAHMGSKVIVMTGVSDPDRLAKLDELHPESILNKPIDVAALLRAM
jgi:DNA-binding response OmpR family regulator